MSIDESRVQSVYFAALGRASPVEQGLYLDGVCGADLDLRRRVEQLLAAQPRVGDFLQGESAASMATVIVESFGEDVGSVIGPYKLREVLGEGGMGTVYAAEQEQPVRRKVALKVIKAGMDSRDVIGRFKAEQQALALMDHPNIAKVLDAGTTDSGLPYFVMELVRGIPITDYCDKSNLSPRERLKLFVPVCLAVQHAHQKGVIHRDLKPSNVLVTLHDGVPVPKVIDFGVAKAINQRLTEQTVYTRVAQMVGTPLYMSPEQAELSGLDVDTRSDVYSLGVLLYELLAGRTPFDKETFAKASFDEVRRIIREDEPPRPSQRVSTLEAKARSTVSGKRGTDERKLTRTLQGELDWIVMKALEKDRQRRYESASAFATDIQRYLDDEPVAACPPSAAYRLRKFARRNKRGLLTAVCIAVAAVAIVMVPVSWILARRGRDAVALHAIDSAFTSARTAFEADDLPLAERSIAQAKAVLAAADFVLREPAEKLAALESELAVRRSDAETFALFVPLARDAQSKIGYSQIGQLAAETLARQALETYGVLSDEDWTEKLDLRHLTKGQNQQVRMTVYETLLALADSLVRWNVTHEKARESLQLLSAAEKQHAPSKGLYWVRHRCHLTLGDTPASQSDKKQYESTRATLPLDYYLPGHTAGWEGDRNAAIKAYQAALRLQPDHYISLFFLGERLATEKRYAEAIAYQTACIALRPDEGLNYCNRAQAQENLGDLASAEEDYIAATAIDTKHSDLMYWRRRLVEFYVKTHQAEKERTARARMVTVGEELIRKVGPTGVLTRRGTIRVMVELAGQFIHAGEYSKSIPLLEELLPEATDVLGSADSWTQSVPRSLGEAYYAVGQADKAVRLLDETLEKMKVALGANHEQTVLTMNSLAGAYRDVGEPFKAVALFEQSLEAREKNPANFDSTNYDRNILLTAQNLALAYKEAGEPRKAVRLFEETLKKLKAKFGGEDPATLNVAHNLADCYLTLGEVGKGLPLLEQTLMKLMDVHGPDHPQTLITMNLLVWGYEEDGQTDKALALAEETVEKTRARLGPDHPRTLSVMHNLANACRAAGQYDEALKLLEQLLEKEKLGPNPLEPLSTMNELALTYSGLAQFDKAIALIEQVLEKQKAKFGPDHPNFITSTSNLAHFYDEAGQFQDAIALYDLALGKRKVQLGAENPKYLIDATKEL